MFCLKALLSSLLMFAALSCAHRKRDEAAQSIVEIRLSNPKSDEWIAEYQFDRPLKQIVFNRDTNLFRREIFLLDAGMKIEESNGREILNLPSERNSLSVRFHTYTEYTPKDYEFFKRFSDGSSIVYTGHLDLKGFKSRYTFVPQKHERIVVAGVIGGNGEPVSWVDTEGRGTYAYFGSIDPVQTSDLAGIFDPALPSWVRESFQNNLPKIMEYYHKRLGVDLPFRPFVLANVEQLESGWLSSSGGTLPGLVMLSIGGKKWKNESVEAWEKAFWFLAHEAAHFWNGQRFRDPDSVIWLHEGGANAFAARVLLNLGIISGSRYQEILSEELNRCLEELDGRPLQGNPGPDKEYRAGYTCGSTIALLTERLIKRQHPHDDLFNFWQLLFRRAYENDNLYTDSLYAKLLEERTQIPGIGDELLQLVRDHSSKGWDSFKIWFDRARIAVDFDTAEPDPSTQIRWTRRLLRSLMASDCEGYVSITKQEKSYLLEGSKRCKNLKKSDEVVRVSGFLIPDSGYKAYKAVYEKCENKNHKVKLDLANGKHVFTDCPKITKAPPRIKLKL